MSPDTASSTLRNKEAAGDTYLLPDMSRFEPAVIGAWECIWNSPYWFSAERDLNEGERVSVAVISEQDGSVLCGLTFIAGVNNRQKDNWLSALAAQINDNDTVKPWLRAGYLDSDDVFHEGPQAGVVRLWCWGGRSRIVCTAPFTGNLQPVLVLPDVNMNAGQTLWLQVRDRTTQRVCETLDITLAGESWQEEFCTSINRRSDFVRAGGRGENGLTPVPAAAGSRVLVPQLAGLDITLDPFEPLDAEDNAVPLADPHGALKRDEQKLDDPAHYRKRAGQHAINLGSRLYLPAFVADEFSRVENVPQEQDDGINTPLIDLPDPQSPIHYAVCCKMKVQNSERGYFFTGIGDVLESEPLETLIPFLSITGKRYAISWDQKRPDAEVFQALLTNRDELSGLFGYVDERYTVNDDYYDRLNPLGLFRYKQTISSSALIENIPKINTSLRQTTAGCYIRYGDDNPQYLPLWNLINADAPDKYAGVNVRLLSDAERFWQLGGNVNIYCLPPLAGLGVFAPDGETALPFGITVVSRQRVSHALPVQSDGYNRLRTPLSKVSSTLCEDAAFTLGSEVFDTSGETESGVDPLTGLYHAHYPLVVLQSRTDPRVRLDLSLHYAATRANESALGDGWAFRRTSFDNRLRRFRHLSGRTFTLTEDNMAALGRGESLTLGDMMLSGELLKDNIKFSVLSTLTVRLPDGEVVTLGQPGGAEEAGEDFKLSVEKRLTALNANLRTLKAMQDNIAKEAGDVTWSDGSWSPSHKKEEALRRAKHYGSQIAANEREIELYKTRAVVLVPVSIGREDGATLTLSWDGMKGHVRLLSVSDGERVLLTATHSSPVAKGRYASVFTVWPDTSEAYEVRLEIEDCLLRTVTRRPVGGREGKQVRFGYCNDPLFDRLLDCVIGEDGEREFITWRSGLVADDGTWVVPAVMARMFLPGGEGAAMKEFWRWRGDVSLIPGPGGTRTSIHTASDGTVTVREWEYSAAGPRPVSVSETRADGTGSTTRSYYTHTVNAKAAPRLQSLATRVTVMPNSPALQTRGEK